MTQKNQFGRFKFQHGMPGATISWLNYINIKSRNERAPGVFHKLQLSALKRITEIHNQYKQEQAQSVWNQSELFTQEFCTRRCKHRVKRRWLCAASRTRGSNFKMVFKRCILQLPSTNGGILNIAAVQIGVGHIRKSCEVAQTKC